MIQNAREITYNLQGRWYRNYGVAPCPVCQPEGRKDQNALTLTDGEDGRLLAHCKKSGCDFREILSAAGNAPGQYSPPALNVFAQRAAADKAVANTKQRKAFALWKEALPIEGTIAETYLRGRGIICALPESLRFHPACWHPTKKRYPAMLARIDGAEHFALHRTYLSADGSGKAMSVPSRAMLGAVSGGAVRLTKGQDTLVVAEGIETSLSLLSGILDTPAAAWAALSTSGMAGLLLPKLPGKLIIATDGDDAGKAAGYRLAERATAKGWMASLLPAPKGRDWNDVLNMKGE